MYRKCFVERKQETIMSTFERFQSVSMGLLLVLSLTHTRISLAASRFKSEPNTVPSKRTGFVSSARIQSAPHDPATRSGRHINPERQIETVPDSLQFAPLSEFCSSECARSRQATTDCWVPREGQLAIVPFSFRGISLCDARRGLCREIENAGRNADHEPYICKDEKTGQIVLRFEPSED